MKKKRRLEENEDAGRLFVKFIERYSGGTGFIERKLIQGLWLCIACILSKSLNRIKADYVV